MRIAAPKRSSSAANTPPTSMSATSVVVRSMKPASRPESARLSIERPPVPVAWNTRQSKSPSSRRTTPCTAGVVTPNIVMPTAGRARRRRASRASGEGSRDHAGERMRGVAEHLLGDEVEALHVGDRIHHHDVGRADIAADLAGGDRRDHHLRDAERQAAHSRRRERRAAGAAGGNDAADAAFAVDPAREGFGHGRDRSAAVAGEDSARSRPGCMAATCSGVTSARDGLPEVERSTVRVGTP